MPDIPVEAVRAAAEAIERELMSGRDCSMAADSDEALARAALEAAAPVLADQIASSILRYADEHEPPSGSGAYPLWHRHFDAASAVAAKAFGRDNLEAAVATEPKSWKSGDRVIVRLPDKRRQSGIRGGHSRDIDVHGTVREVDLPGRHPGVKVDLDEEINGARDCYAMHGELRPEVPREP